MRLAAALALSVFLLGAHSATAVAAPAPPATQAKQKKKDCGGVPVLSQVCTAGKAVGGALLTGGGSAVPGAAGAAAAAVGGGIMDQLTKWATDGARWITSKIQKLIDRTTTPELTAGWYRDRFAAMAALGGGLSVLVAMLALGSAALRRDPDALGATFLGMFRAGIGTGVLLALTVLALGVADGISNWVAADASGQTGSKFWGDVASAWGKDGGAGFGSAVIAFFFAIIQVLAGLAVWIEMLLRQAGIYVAVLFMPAALAASIWPALSAWKSRLVSLLFVLIAMKPVIVVVLSLAGSAAAAGGDADKDLGILVAAVMILVLAAFVPWVLMMLISMDHESAWTARAASSGMKSSMAGGAGRVGGGLGSAASRIGGGSGGGSRGGALGGGRAARGGAMGGSGGGGGAGGGGSGRGGSGGGGGSRGGGSSGGGGMPAGGGGSSSGGANGRSGDAHRPAPAGAVAAAAGLAAPGGGSSRAAPGRRAAGGGSSAGRPAGRASGGKAPGAGGARSRPSSAGRPARPVTPRGPGTAGR